MKRRVMLLVLAAVLVQMLLPSLGDAACTGASPSWSCANWDDWAALCNGASLQNGDSISLAAGTFSATNTCATSKYFILTGQGAGSGTGQTNVTQNTGSGTSLMSITESASGSTKVSNIYFIEGNGPGSSGGNIAIIRMLPGGGGARPIVIMDNKFLTFFADDINVKTNQGVIFRNTSDSTVDPTPCLNSMAFVRQVITEDPTVMEVVLNWGNTDTNGNSWLYVDGNTVTNKFQGLDIDAGGRAAIRRNTLTNTGVLTHGDSGIGGRALDVDTNVFAEQALSSCSLCIPQKFPNITNWIGMRGGTARIHGNTIPDLTANGCYQARGAVSFKIWELQRNSGPFHCWDGGYPAPTQPGWGYTAGGSHPAYGGYTGVTGGAGYPVIHGEIEPIYLWSNTGADGAHENYNNPNKNAWGCGIGESCTNSSPVNFCNNQPNPSTMIVSGRDYFLDTNPGHTAYRYPHVLTGLACQFDCGTPQTATGAVLNGSIKIGGAVRIR